ncbi:MAG: YybS family protein [Deltaproteobacteria bacterium]|nr:YybS family protein [Deltaproteobacteria bacterium]
MKTANIIGFAGSVILLLSISVWMPVIGPFFSLIIPLPFIFYFYRLEIKEGLINGVIILFIVWLTGKVTGHPYMFLICLEFGIVGLVVSELFKRRLSIGATVFWGTAAMLFMGAIFLFLTGMSEGSGPFDMILGYLKAGLDQTVGIYEQSGIEQEKLEQIRQALDLLGRLIARIFPALVIVSTGLVIWLNVILSRPVFRLGRLDYPPSGDADRWRAPEFLVWGIIVSGFALFLPSTGIKFVAENLLVVLSVIYVFHGLSVLMFFFNKYRIPGWARAGIYFLILLQQAFLVMLAFVGLFDQWADFRKIHKKMEEIQ